MGLVSVTASNPDQSIAGDIVEICGYWRINVFALLPGWPLNNWARSVCDKADQARSLHCDLSRPLHYHKGSRPARGASYMFEVNKRWTIDGSPRWNVARYINHSCRPNAKPVGRKGGIVIIALRQIEPGEEITYDYGREYLKCLLDNGGCRCTACRKKRAFQRQRTRASDQ
jgi:hypothetical protein